jgi:hypothetical protein
VGFERAFKKHSTARETTKATRRVKTGGHLDGQRVEHSTTLPDGRLISEAYVEARAVL